MSTRRKLKPTRTASNAKPANERNRDLETVDRLLSEGRLSEAMTRLSGMRAASPHRIPVLERILVASFALRSWRSAVETAETLIRLEPDRPIHHRALADVLVEAGYRVNALEEARLFVKQSPDSPQLEPAREIVRSLERELAERASAAGCPLDFYFDSGLRTERCRLLMLQNRMEEARDTAVDLIRDYPAFVPAYNNQSECEFVLGRISEAVEANRKALKIQPADIHALVFAIHLARTTFATPDTLASLVRRLLASNRDTDRKSRKTMEALVMAGAWKDAVDYFDRLNLEEVEPRDRAIVLDYAACAYFETGDRSFAERCWKQAIEIEPNDELALHNLKDMKLAAAKRHGPMICDLVLVLPACIMQRLGEAARCFKVRPGATDARFELLKTMLEAEPLVAAALPAIFDLCASDQVLPFVEYLTVIEDRRIRDHAFQFARGHRGSDELRAKILAALRLSGYPMETEVAAWINGAPGNVEVFDCEITRDPDESTSPAVSSICQQGYDHITNKRYKAAEEVFRYGMALFPDEPSFPNNLARTLQQMGRESEAERVIKHMAEKFPDYLFGKTAMAMEAARAGRIDEARALLRPHKLQGRLHISEALAIISANMEIIYWDPAAKASDMDPLIRLVRTLCPGDPLAEELEWMQKLKDELSPGRRSRRNRAR